jgi:GntR family histidine utilization transcriptional repressor
MRAKRARPEGRPDSASGAGRAAPTVGATLPAPAKPADAAIGPLKLDGHGPAWLQIRRALSGPILDGTWPPGTRIPAEMELTDHFHTSRMTVNKAIQSLASEGLVQRWRKIGTIVSERAQERPVFEIWNTEDMVTRVGGTYGYRLLERQIVKDDPIKRAQLNVSRKTELMWIRCVHLSNGQPFQLEERLVNADAAPGISTQPLDSVGPSAWLLAHVPWTQAEHTISASEAGVEEAAALNIPVGSACLVVERRTWNGDTPVTLARLWHAGAQHRLVGRFEPRR